MNARTLVIRLDRGQRIEDLAVELNLEPDDDPLDPTLWSSGGVSMRLLDEVADRGGRTVTVEFCWPDDEDGPDDWTWALTRWATVLDGLSEDVA